MRWLRTRPRTARWTRWSAAALAGALVWCGFTRADGAPMRTPLPEFTQTAPAAWINAAPLTLADLRGHVVLVHVWAFECWNCYRSFPWLNGLDEKYRGRGLVTIGIHSPEFPQESEPARVLAKTREFGLHHAVMLDNDHAYWRALDNRYWPAWYVVDANGDIRAVVVGEAHAGDQRARAIEAAIDALLAEASSRAAPARRSARRRAARAARLACRACESARAVRRRC
jgi:thiol-disulfide isomerase/thioredoxin